MIRPRSRKPAKISVSPMDREGSGRNLRKRLSKFDRQLRQLSDLCKDSSSHQRLFWLRGLFETQKSGVVEAAEAEVELALLLGQAGFSVAFLPETGTRTADLECYLGQDRLFVEVTVITGNGVPSSGRHAPAPRSFLGEGQDHVDEETILSKRIVAKIFEKGRQLSSYCAPVILSITVKNAHEAIDDKLSGLIHLDIKRLLGILASIFPQVSQLSGVLVTLWNIKPRESTSNIWLSNIHVVERRGRQAEVPCVRLLGWNPFARYPAEEAIRRVLLKVL